MKKMSASKPNESHHFPGRVDSRAILKVKLSESLSKEIKFSDTSKQNSWVCGFQACITKRNGTYTVDLPNACLGENENNNQNFPSSNISKKENTPKLTKAWPIVNPDTQKFIQILQNLGLKFNVSKAGQESTLDIENCLKISFSEEATNVNLTNRSEKAIKLKKTVLKILLNLSSV